MTMVPSSCIPLAQGAGLLHWDLSSTLFYCRNQLAWQREKSITQEWERCLLLLPWKSTHIWPSYKPQVVTNCVFLIFWMPDLKPWGLICKVLSAGSCNWSLWELCFEHILSYKNTKYSETSNWGPKIGGSFDPNLPVTQLPICKMGILSPSCLTGVLWIQIHVCP